MTTPNPIMFLRNAFQKVTSVFIQPTPEFIDPCRPPIPAIHTVNPESFDSIMTRYLDKQLSNYMNNVHQCDTCSVCWPSHKKTALKLFKLHPNVYKDLNDIDTNSEDEELTASLDKQI
jgi:hypothetical protein